ncbi:MAG: hypothetical protein R3B95_07910 [Nitrospirales bacterium]|nr:hypothetical protein [Nitrospirales bacterium]
MKTISIDPRQEQKNGFIKTPKYQERISWIFLLLMRQEAWDATLKYMSQYQLLIDF